MLYVRAGEYDGEVKIGNSGADGKPDPGARLPGQGSAVDVPTTGNVINASSLTVVGSYVTIDGEDRRPHLVGAGRDHLQDRATDGTWSICEIDRVTNQGLIVSGYNNLIWRNQIDDNGTRVAFNDGVYVEGSTTCCART